MNSNLPNEGVKHTTDRTLGQPIVQIILPEFNRPMTIFLAAEALKPREPPNLTVSTELASHLARW